MTEVFKILVSNSYLANQMRAMAEQGENNMPPEIKAALGRLTTDGGPPKNFAPIP